MGGDCTHGAPLRWPRSPALDASGDGRLMCEVSRGWLAWRCETPSVRISGPAVAVAGRGNGCGCGSEFSAAEGVPGSLAWGGVRVGTARRAAERGEHAASTGGGAGAVVIVGGIKAGF